MKHLKNICVIALAAIVTAAVSAGTASATTLEVGGVTKNEKVSLTMSLRPDSSAFWQPTGGGSLVTTCTKSHVEGHTETPYTGHEVGGPVTLMTFSECTDGGITVVFGGYLSFTHIEGTTSGTVTSRNTEVKVPSPIGTLTCRTNNGVDIGTLTGATTAGNPGQHAIMDINGVINCGFLLPSAEWKGEYIVTSPTELGVSA